MFVGGGSGCEYGFYLYIFPAPAEGGARARGGGVKKRRKESFNKIVCRVLILLILSVNLGTLLKASVGML